MNLEIERFFYSGKTLGLFNSVFPRLKNDIKTSRKKILAAQINFPATSYFG
jgi:hypothetical protein